MTEAAKARDKAQRELVAARQALSRTKGETEHYRTLADQLRLHRTDNHIARDMRAAFRGR